MTRWGPWNTRNIALWNESQRLYNGGPRPVRPRIPTPLLLRGVQEGDTAYAGLLLAGFDGEAVAS
jgi:hypothetical protein